MYEGRSINKEQNRTIPLILKIGKILNIRFVGNLSLNINRNFSMMTSLLWRHLIVEHSLSVYYSLSLFITGQLQQQHRRHSDVIVIKLAACTQN